MRVGTEASSGEQNADGEYTLNGIGNRLGYPGDFPDTFYVELYLKDKQDSCPHVAPSCH